MYILLYAMLLVLAGWLSLQGLRRKNKAVLAAGLVGAGLVVVFFQFLDFWGEMLWFENLGLAPRFWTAVVATGASLLLGGLTGLLLTLALTRHISTNGPLPGRQLVVAVGTILGGLWGHGHWQVILQYLHAVRTSLREPILNQDTGFYLFILPFYDAIYFLFLELAGLALLASLFFSTFKLARRDQTITIDRHNQSPLLPRLEKYRSITNNGALLLLIVAGGFFLQRYHLLYSGSGVVAGPGWTDVHIRLPAYTLLSLLFTATALVVFFLPVFQKGLGRPTIFGLSITGFGLLILLAFPVLGLLVIPGLCQWLLVKPNEITYEEPYIKHNIKFTRHGFGLHRTEERQFPATGGLSPQTVKEHPNIFENIRLWDRSALDAVYKQFQEIRLYYEFHEVDIDRYRIDNRYRQVMISSREMQPANLPPSSQTFVNLRFKYTHGYGVTMAPVSEFTPEGLPHLLIKNIPPQSLYPELAVKRPEIYYGELTDSHVVVNSTEKEFDYPQGEKNVYRNYQGKGGVQLTTFWRKFLFGYKFDGTSFLLSGYPTAESRVMFHRQVRQRVQTIAPFLRFDADPYIVLAEDGRLLWLIDAYTVSSKYPYSETFLAKEDIEYRDGDRQNILSGQVGQQLQGANYIRNSVKAVVDAYDGSVSLYVFEPRDPIIQVWSRIFPGLFKSREQMPATLQEHVRYPADFLLLQGLVYAKYHMTDPRVFYNQEDLWVRSTEKYYSRVKPLEPYYVIWEEPGSDEPQFVLMMPFTPKNRQVMIGWIAGMCDGDDYGRFLVYKFPKEKRILGPQQVETKIDQDRFLSGQLSLWDQRGSKVIRGNVLAIPVAETILYVEPIYLQAETAAYPELRLVVVMHGDRMSYGESFELALADLFATSKDKAGQPAADRLDTTVFSLIQQAAKAFETYLTQLGDKQFSKASEAMARLAAVLEQLMQRTPPANE